MFDQQIIDHDSWAHGEAKVRTAGKIELGDVPGVLPFSGVRNPITTSSTSQKVLLRFKTEANGWQLKIGAAESLAEAAVAHEALCCPDVYDVEFQPLYFPYEFPLGVKRSHTIDLRVTFRSGMRVLLFVRNAASLAKPSIQAEIAAIRQAFPRHGADVFHVVDADAYNRPRRDNLRRMHHSITFEPDPVADDLVEAAACNLRTLSRVSDLFRCVALPPGRVFNSCLRLIARGVLDANMDAVICEHSLIRRKQTCL